MGGWVIGWWCYAGSARLHCLLQQWWLLACSRQRLSSCSPLCLAPTLQAYLASETEGEESAEEERGAGEEEDEEAIRARYRALLLGGGDAALERQGKKDWGGDESGSENGSGSEDEEGGSEGEQPKGRGASKQLAGRTRVSDDKGEFPCGAMCCFAVSHCIASVPHSTIASHAANSPTAATAFHWPAASSKAATCTCWGRTSPVGHSRPAAGRRRAPRTSPSHATVFSLS
jgi:hypothetical protein